MLIKQIIFWALMAAFVLPAYMYGFIKLFGTSAETNGHFKRWGYPLGFMRLLGLGEIVAGTALLFQVTRFYAMPVFAVILAGAIYTHLKHNDPKKEVMTPVYVSLHLVVICAMCIWML